MDGTSKIVVSKVNHGIEMLGYARSLYSDDANEYYTVNSEMVFGIKSPKSKSYGNIIEPYEWQQDKILRRSIKDDHSSPRTIKLEPVHNIKQKSTEKGKKKKSKHKSKGKSQHCIHASKKIKRRKKFIKIHKKYLISIILGLLAAKSLLLHIVLKVVTLMSAKGLIMGFISTIFASVVSVKGIFERSQKNESRKEDTKTVVEVIHIPTKSREHYYYDKKHKRSDGKASNIKTSRIS